MAELKVVAGCVYAGAVLTLKKAKDGVLADFALLPLGGYMAILVSEICRFLEKQISEAEKQIADLERKLALRLQNSVTSSKPSNISGELNSFRILHQSAGILSATEMLHRNALPIPSLLKTA